MIRPLQSLLLFPACCLLPALSQAAEPWRIDTAGEWRQFEMESDGLTHDSGTVAPTGDAGRYLSVTRTFGAARSAKSIVIRQSPVWQNWKPLGNIKPSNLEDAPVLLTIGPDNYWIFGLYGQAGRRNGFQPEEARLDGFDIPLMTTPFPNQFDAPGGLEKGLGGYHAWHSRDMVHWVHHGPVTEWRSRWVTTAEHADGKTYIYYDFPNDQDPHLYIDDDLTDGKPGRDVGLSFKDPSDGSDCAVIRDPEGRFHLIVEDWSPIDASRHSWDSPLAGHAVSPDGIGDWKIMEPPVDERTTPTGKIEQYLHPHWSREDPANFPTSIAKFEVHEPRQNAFGDWAAICIGGRYYLVSDFHPANGPMGVALFTSDSIDKPFQRVGKIASGHPDPDIAFAEGRFYLVTQAQNDFVSPGPWVPTVEVRVGVDTDNDGALDRWTGFREVGETYDYIAGFSKQVQCTPASLDLGDLPAGFGFGFELRLRKAPESAAKPILDSLVISFDGKN